ncbi:MAG: NAD(P)-dependent oxidoreductase [Pseudomonadota bacterium]
MSAPTVLVTGAGGFVCSEIVLALQSSGFSVVAVDRDFDEAAKRRLAGIELVTGALPQVLDAWAGRRVDAVIHGAAITAPPDALGISRAKHLAANIEPLTAALRFARGAAAPRFLFLSSMGVFAPKDLPLSKGLVTEATHPTATCAYCVGKRAGELLVTNAQEHGFRTLSLRLGNTCGPEEGVRASRPYLSRLRRMVDAAGSDHKILVRTPEAVREWAWLPQLAQGVVALIRDGFGDAPVIHAGTPPAIGDLELAHAVARRMRGVAVDALAAGESVRPPMGSDVPSPFSAIDWLSVEDILDNLMPVEALN